MPSTPQKIALVTGAGSGIGKASAIALGKAGFTLVLAGRRPDPLDAVAKEIGGQTMVVPANVSDPEAVKLLFARIKRSFERLDLLFNNAGTFVPAASIEDITLEQWRNAVAVNVSAAFLCTQEAVRMMKAQSPRGGRIINNGS